MGAKVGSKQETINKSMPALYRAKLGDAVAELIAQVNNLTIGHNALAAKLDLDLGVNDTNYASLTGVSASTVKDLESR